MGCVFYGHPNFRQRAGNPLMTKPHHMLRTGCVESQPGYLQGKKLLRRLDCG